MVKYLVRWVLSAGNACRKLVYPAERSHYEDSDVLRFTSTPEAIQGNNWVNDIHLIPCIVLLSSATTGFIFKWSLGLQPPH